MEDKENKGKLLNCLIRGPGPVYKLPTLVGYIDHDPSKHRNPAYTIRHYTAAQLYSLGPGPCYNVHKLTKLGPDRSPAYTIALKKNPRIEELGPGPGAYQPEVCPPMNHNRRPPAYSIKSRAKSRYDDEGPGPNAYSLPTCIGPKIPDKSAQAAYTIGGYRNLRIEDTGPGPAGTGNLNQNAVKKRHPAYSLKGRHDPAGEYLSPGPKYHPIFNTGKRQPVYSFGIRHSECSGTPITALDED